MIPCTGISFFITLFFVKRVPLKREDDAAKKAEAKAWVESKKSKHNGGIWGKASVEPDAEKTQKNVEDSEVVADDVEAEKRIRKESTATGKTLVDSADGGMEEGTVHKVEKHLEEAGRGLEEASGGIISGKEGLEQGPVGSGKI